MKILLVEDEDRMGRFISRGLAEAVYACTWVKTVAEAEDALAETPFDLVILDLGLPDGDGLDLLARWRKCGFREPILILSARGEMCDRIRGLDSGADDYLAKPFGLDELLARARSLMRRNSVNRTEHLEHRGMVLRPEARAATIGGEAVALTRREFAILEILFRNRGRVVTRPQIADSVWESHDDVQTNLIDVYLARLRTKLERHSGAPRIHTHRGIGYRLD